MTGTTGTMGTTERMSALAETPGRWLRRIAMLFVAGVLMTTSGCGVVGGGDRGLEIVAYFPDSAGLFVGNDVGILGVPVGTISAIEPKGDKVKVTLEIEPGHKVPADAGAVVVARSVATDRYVELTPVYHDGPAMKSGAEIGLDRTRTPVDFDDVLASLNSFATGVAGNKATAKAIQKFIDAGAEALKGKGPLLNQSVHALAESVNGINSQRSDIKGTLKSLDVLLTAVAKDNRTARRFIQQVSAASKLLNAERNNFRTAMRSLNSAVTMVAEFAVDNRKSIIRALGGSTQLMRIVLAKERQLAEILQVMPLALQNVQRARNGNNQLRVMLDPTMFFPAGKTLRELCNGLPEIVCGPFG